MFITLTFTILLNFPLSDILQTPFKEHFIRDTYAAWASAFFFLKNSSDTLICQALGAVGWSWGLRGWLPDNWCTAFPTLFFVDVLACSLHASGHSSESDNCHILTYLLQMLSVLLVFSPSRLPPQYWACLGFVRILLVKCWNLFQVYLTPLSCGSLFLCLLLPFLLASSFSVSSPCLPLSCSLPHIPSSSGSWQGITGQ